MLLAVLLLAAILIPLSFVNWNALFHPARYEEIEYYDPDYRGDIFENEEYLSHLGKELSVTVCTPGEVEYNHPFTDRESAEAVFAEIGSYGRGAGTIGAYLSALMNGCDTPAEQKVFRALFAEDYKIFGGKGRVSAKETSSELPLSFPPQKIYNVRLDYAGKYEHEGKTTDRWKVSIDVVKNDGTVLNYFGARDGGEAWFLVSEEETPRIVLISGIIPMN